MKTFFKTNEFDYWSNPIVKDIHGITYVLVDGIPHPITDEGEPLYPIKDFKLLNFKDVFLNVIVKFCG